ncbi:hypothetical protein B0T20DRAFT_438675 [Sordaria brevicollis]|uniref:Cytoskeleton-associated protein n=1 Tax=Sordaria brevicollis TaxID=83679 RepID=A0AAE0UB25_SORBR|nr:hypothetical protein B0T20DRAFT_438675 [Sordaria brevicollis]
MGWQLSALRDERVVFTGVGFMTAGLIFFGMHTWLTLWRDETIVTPNRPKTQYITQQTEDSLELKTLDTLLGHYNPSIKETAAKIICDRAASDPVLLETLLRGITSQDYDERVKNLRALAIICSPRVLPLLNTWKSYSAIVRCLELSLDPEQEILDNDSWDDYPLRDISEKMCFVFLEQLVDHYGPLKLIHAKFVERWLSKQNWGFTAEDKERNFHNYMLYKDNKVRKLADAVCKTELGRAALVKCGLMSQESADDFAAEQADNQNLLDTSGDRYNLLLSINMGRTPRAQETSAEEQRIRHRNREAIVMNDGTRPIGRDDIIHRDSA